LGVNTFNMAFPAILLSHGLRKAINSQNKSVSAGAAFICGGGAILLSSCLVAFSLYLTGSEFKFVALEIIAANLPIVVIEGLICALVVSFLAKVRPELLAGPGGRP